MKKNSISPFYSLLSATLFFSLVSFQASSQDFTASVRSTSKVHAVSSASTETPVAVDAKVIHSFKRSFAGVQNPVWEVSDDIYYAHFQSEDRQVVAAFRKNGRINYTIYYGAEKHLPAHEKGLVQENFAGYVITATQNIVKHDVNMWLITIEGDKDIYKVKVKGDDVSVSERMTKGK